jgi:hypothetical protein
MKIRNKYRIIFYIFICLFLTAGIQVKSEETGFKILEDFESYKNPDKVFSEWLLRDDNEKAAAKIYVIKEEEKNKYLNADSKNDSIQIAKKISWDIKTYPVLQWKWRVNTLPENGNEDINSKNDSAAAVYVIFQRKNMPFLSWKYQPINVIKYVWSATLPEKQIVRKKKEKIGSTIYEGRFIVLKTGTSQIGSWITEERNVLNDYLDQFGHTPEYNPLLIAILTDSNNTQTTANADYDDFIIGKK